MTEIAGPNVVAAGFGVLVRMVRLFGADQIQTSSVRFITSEAGARFLVWVFDTPADYVDYICAVGID